MSNVSYTGHIIALHGDEGWTMDAWYSGLEERPDVEDLRARVIASFNGFFGVPPSSVAIEVTEVAE